MRQLSGNIRIYQSGIKYINEGSNSVPSHPFMAQIVAVYSDRMACDIKTPDGQTILNVPVKTKAGLVGGEPYGELDLPEVDDWVIVNWAGHGLRKKVIVDTIVPYLANEFTADAVNSADKQFTKKLLEAGKEKHYRKIFKSGTTVEVAEDGTITIEVPSGTYVLIDEANSKIHIEDQHGNIVDMASSGLVLEDANGNDITMASGKVTVNGNLEVLQ